MNFLGELDKWLGSYRFITLMLCSVQGVMADCDIDKSGKGPTLKDLTAPDLCNTREKPLVCIPSGACCGHDEWCHCGHCLSCYPDHLTTESEKRNFCIGNGQGNVSQMQHISCSGACHATFGWDIFLTPESQANWELTSAAIGGIIGFFIGIVLSIVLSRCGIGKILMHLRYRLFRTYVSVKTEDKTDFEDKKEEEEVLEEIKVPDFNDTDLNKQKQLNHEERRSKKSGDQSSGMTDTKEPGQRNYGIHSESPSAVGALSSSTRSHFSTEDDETSDTPAESGLDVAGTYKTTGNARAGHGISDGKGVRICNESNLQQGPAVIATSQAKHGAANDGDLSLPDQ